MVLEIIAYIVLGAIVAMLIVALGALTVLLWKSLKHMDD